VSKELRPDEKFLSDLAFKVFMSTIPQGYRFFGRDNLVYPEQLKLFAKGFSDLVGHLWFNIKSAKRATLMRRAWSEYLDLWALEANLQRRKGESDISLRRRVVMAILGLKTSKPGTRDQVADLIAKNGFLLYEAWRELAYLQQPNFKSFVSLLNGKTGSSVLMDQSFYRISTYSVDLYEDEYAELAALLVQKINEIRTLGVKVFIRQGFQGTISTGQSKISFGEYKTNQELCSSVFEPDVFEPQVFYEQICEPPKSVFESGVFEPQVFYEQINKPPRKNPFQPKILTNNRLYIKTSENKFLVATGII
jgi:hypothetical protein